MFPGLWYSHSSLSPFFFGSSVFPPTLRLGTQRVTRAAKRQKKEWKRKEERKKKALSLCLFLRQQVGDAERWHPPSCTTMVPHGDWWAAGWLSARALGK